MSDATVKVNWVSALDNYDPSLVTQIVVSNPTSGCPISAQTFWRQEDGTFLGSAGQRLFPFGGSWVWGVGTEPRGRVRFTTEELIAYYEAGEVQPYAGAYGAPHSTWNGDAWKPMSFVGPASLEWVGPNESGNFTLQGVSWSGFYPIRYMTAGGYVDGPGSLLPELRYFLQPGGGYSDANWYGSKEDYLSGLYPAVEHSLAAVYSGDTPPTADGVDVENAPIGASLAIGGTPPYKPGIYPVTIKTQTGKGSVYHRVGVQVGSGGLPSSVLTPMGWQLYEEGDYSYSDEADGSPLLITAEEREGLKLASMTEVTFPTQQATAKAVSVPNGCTITPDQGGYSIGLGELDGFNIPLFYNFTINLPAGTEDPDDPVVPSTPGEGDDIEGDDPPDDPPPPGGGWINTGGGAPGFNPGPTPGPINLEPIWWLYPDSNDIQLGTVCIGGFAEDATILRNLGNQPIIIKDITFVEQAGSVFRIPDIPKDVIPAGGFAEIEFYYSPTAEGLHFTEINITTAKVIDVQAISVNTEANTATVLLSEAPTYAVDDTIRFYGTNLDPTTDYVITAVSSNSVTIDITNKSVNPQTTAGGHTLGEELEEEVYIAVTGSGDDCVPEEEIIKEVRLDGDVVGSGNLNFGERTIGIDAVRLVKVTNIGNFPVQITGAELSVGSDRFTIEDKVATIAPGGFTTVAVTFNPDEESPVNAILRIACDATNIDPDGHAYFTAAGSGRPGETPIVRAIRIDGTLLFGDLLVGQTVDLPITITNIGDTAVLITRIDIPLPFKLSTESTRFTRDVAEDGTTALLLADAAFTLAPLETTDPIIVTFVPTEQGSYIELLEVEVEVTEGVTTKSAEGRSVLDFDDGGGGDGGDDGDDGDDGDLNPLPDPPNAGDVALDGVGDSCVVKSCEPEYLYSYEANKP